MTEGIRLDGFNVRVVDGNNDPVVYIRSNVDFIDAVHTAARMLGMPTVPPPDATDVIRALIDAASYRP